MQVPILKQGECLIATVQGTTSDADWRQLQDGLLWPANRAESYPWERDLGEAARITHLHFAPPTSESLSITPSISLHL